MKAVTIKQKHQARPLNRQDARCAKKPNNLNRKDAKYAKKTTYFFRAANATIFNSIRELKIEHNP